MAKVKINWPPMSMKAEGEDSTSTVMRIAVCWDTAKRA